MNMKNKGKLLPLSGLGLLVHEVFFFSLFFSDSTYGDYSERCLGNAKSHRPCSKKLYSAIWRLLGVNGQIVVPSVCWSRTEYIMLFPDWDDF